MGLNILLQKINPHLTSSSQRGRILLLHAIVGSMSAPERSHDEAVDPHLIAVESKGINRYTVVYLWQTLLVASEDR
jgi:hypothetical protein